jgi:hypothetical protein
MAFTQEEIDFLIKNYPEKGKMWCCEQLNKTESQIRVKAAKLKLRLNKNSDFFIDFQRRAAKSKVGKKRPGHSAFMKELVKTDKFDKFRITSEEDKIRISITNKKWIKENGHPRGMLGKTHSKELKQKMSERVKKMWQDPNSKLNSIEHRQAVSNRMSKLMNYRLKNSPSNIYSKSKKGTISIGGNIFFARSSWEANIAAYLEFLKQNKEIAAWEHEPETFWFEAIKRGVRSYLPDFRITNIDGSIYYIEVKGWMDNKSKTKLKRMSKYYPNVVLELIDSKRYNAISKNKGVIPNWGMLDSVQDNRVVRKCLMEECDQPHHSKNLCRKHFYEKYKK